MQQFLTREIVCDWQSIDTTSAVKQRSVLSGEDFDNFLQYTTWVFLINRVTVWVTQWYDKRDAGEQIVFIIDV
jgi:hypothetical protein